MPEPVRAPEPFSRFVQSLTALRVGLHRLPDYWFSAFFRRRASGGRAGFDGEFVIGAPFRPASIVDGCIRLAEHRERERQHRCCNPRSTGRHDGLGDVDVDRLEQCAEFLGGLEGAVGIQQG